VYAALNAEVEFDAFDVVGRSFVCTVAVFIRQDLRQQASQARSASNFTGM
jgi:hypothetical protein